MSAVSEVAVQGHRVPQIRRHSVGVGGHGNLVAGSTPSQSLAAPEGQALKQSHQSVRSVVTVEIALVLFNPPGEPDALRSASAVDPSSVSATVVILKPVANSASLISQTPPRILRNRVR